MADKLEWVINGDYQNRKCYRTAKSQNSEITKRRLLQNDDFYKTAKNNVDCYKTMKKRRLFQNDETNLDFYKTVENNIL